MHATLVKIQRKLTELINQLQSAIPNDEPFGPAHGNWSFPGLTKSELVEDAQSIIDMIGSAEVDELGAREARIADYIRRIDHLRTQTVGQTWGNAGQAAPAYMLTLDGLRKAVAPLYPTQTDDERGEAAAKLRKLVAQVRSMEARIKELEPRTGSLATMVQRIENAYDAADQLPTDLEALAEARGTIEQLAKDAGKDQGEIAGLREKATTLTGELGQSATDAKAVLERCETAYSAATSVGLRRRARRQLS